MSPCDLQRHVIEFAGRHNIREADTIDQTRESAAAMTRKRLMARRLVGERLSTAFQSAAGLQPPDYCRTKAFVLVRLGFSEPVSSIWRFKNPVFPMSVAFRNATAAVLAKPSAKVIHTRELLKWSRHHAADACCSSSRPSSKLFPCDRRCRLARKCRCSVLALDRSHRTAHPSS